MGYSEIGSANTLGIGRKLPCAMDKIVMANASVIPPRLVKTSLAARYLNVSQWKLRRLVQTGEIPYIPGEGTSPWLFDLKDLDNWIEHRKRTL